MVPEGNELHYFWLDVEADRICFFNRTGLHLERKIPLAGPDLDLKISFQNLNLYVQIAILGVSNK